MASRSVLRLALLLVLVSLFVGPRQARADTPAPESAADWKKAGDDAFDARRYDEALDDYTKAYSLSHEPALLYNMGRARQFRGEYPEALELLERFAREAPPELRAHVPGLDEVVADVRSRVATLSVQCNISGARIILRQKVIATTPAGPITVSAGPATLEVAADGYNSFKRDIDLRGGATLSVDATLLTKDRAGVLRVDASVPGGTVLIDGKPVGNPPVEQILLAGPHEVVVRLAGYDDAQSQAVVLAGQTRDITLPMTKQPPLYARWWFWTGVGVLVVGGAVLTYALLTEKQPGSGDISPGTLAVPLLRY